MTDNKKQETETWSYEQEREERKQRLENLKTRDGKKKPIRNKVKISSILLILLVIALIAGLFFWQSYQSGGRERRSVAMTLNGDPVYANEVNFYVSIFAKMIDQRFQSGVFTDANRAVLAEEVPFGEEGQTVRDLLIQYAKEQISSDYVTMKEAETAGFEPSSEGNDLVDMILEQLNMYAAQTGMTVNEMLAQQYGPGNDKDELRRLVTRYVAAEEFRNQKAEELEPDRDELEKIYEENKDDYDEVTFRLMSFPASLEDYVPEEQMDEYRAKIAAADPEADEEPAEEAEAEGDAEEEPAEEETEAEEAEEAEDADAEDEGIVNITDEELQQNALDRAEIMAEMVSNEQLFLKYQSQFAPQNIVDSVRDNPDMTKTSSDKAKLPEAIATYLFDPARQPEDATVIDSEQGVYFVMFLDRGRNEDKAFTTRHILIMVDPEAEDAEQADAEAKAEAERILAEYQAGEQTAERFGEMANLYSQDPGNQGQNGGLYADIAPGSFMQEYEDWSLDPARKEGDVGIVKTDAGYHIIYFDHLGGEIWADKIAQETRVDRVRDWLTEMRDSLEVEVKKGMDVVLPTE